MYQTCARDPKINPCVKSSTIIVVSSVEPLSSIITSTVCERRKMLFIFFKSTSLFVLTTAKGFASPTGFCGHAFLATIKY
jgi:hypothetical protein